MLFFLLVIYYYSCNKSADEYKTGYSPAGSNLRPDGISAVGAAFVAEQVYHIPYKQSNKQNRRYYLY